mmetsp:Transcript_52025/g.135455  ORF Transcript_52025/g.135455 Transcript_52025/m.135455 type:complete len:206 (+) Transcript_52025:783-1400(+)
MVPKLFSRYSRGSAITLSLTPPHQQQCLRVTSLIDRSFCGTTGRNAMVSSRTFTMMSYSLPPEASSLFLVSSAQSFKCFIWPKLLAIVDLRVSSDMLCKSLYRFGHLFRLTVTFEWFSNAPSLKYGANAAFTPSTSKSEPGQWVISTSDVAALKKCPSPPSSRDKNTSTFVNFDNGSIILRILLSISNREIWPTMHNATPRLGLE